MSLKTPKRIHIHKLKFHWFGKKTGMIPFDNLDPDEKKVVAEDILMKLHLAKGQNPYNVYAETLADWGIVCPHPQHMRLYSGTKRSEIPLDDHKWYKCGVCGCSTFNEDFFTQQKAI